MLAYVGIKPPSLKFYQDFKVMGNYRELAQSLAMFMAGSARGEMDAGRVRPITPPEIP